MNFSDYYTNMNISYYCGSFITCGDWWGERDASCVYSKIYYIVGGECEIIIEGHPYHGSCGDLFIIPAGVRHSYRHINQNYVTKYWFHFNLDVGGRSFFDAVKLPCFSRIGKQTELISLFQAVLDSQNDSTLSGQLLLKADLLRLLSYCIKTLHADEVICGDTKLDQVLSFMQEHLRMPMNLSMLAGMAHLHPNYFVRLFKEKTGLSPMKYLAQRRMEYAKSALENTDLPISAIMEETGFQDVSHFSKTFKRYSGHAPNIYRKLYHK